jgi:hypothetical protein
MTVSSAIRPLRLPGRNDGSGHRQTFIDAAAIGGKEPQATRGAMHLPLNMGKVFNRVHSHIEAAGGYDPDNTIVLSRDLSPWKAEHLFATDKNVPDEDTTSLSGDFVTKVFEGPYREAKSWYSEMENVVRSRGKDPKRIYFYYTTCPKCAAAMGKNYVVGLATI